MRQQREYGQLQNLTLGLAGVHEQLIASQAGGEHKRVLSQEAKYLQIAITKCKKLVSLWQDIADGKYTAKSTDDINQTVDFIRASKDCALKAAQFFSQRTEQDERFHERVATFDRQLAECEKNEVTYGNISLRGAIIIGR